MGVNANDIRAAEVFGALTELQREEVAQGGTIRRLSKGEYIFRAGDTADFLFVVQQGRVGLYADAHDGILHAINILSNGQLLGISAFFPIATWDLTARCQTDTTVLTIPRRSMLAHMISDPDLELRVLQGVLELERRRIVDLVAVITQTKALDAFERAFGQDEAHGSGTPDLGLGSWPGPTGSR